MKDQNYYVTVGDNGGVIADSHQRALCCKQYMRGNIDVKEAESFEKAEVILRDHLEKVAPAGCPVPDHFARNDVVTIRKLMWLVGKDIYA